jgi:hypothetical protein
LECGGLLPERSREIARESGGKPPHAKARLRRAEKAALRAAKEGAATRRTVQSSP